TMERDESNIMIYWIHYPYENFCMDVVENSYYEANKTHHYFMMLKELFNIDLTIKEILDEQVSNN
ncbi:MAG TPA: hypothetical protein VKR58_14760, partial [Aquella sp.]|nr:hypothetical protein [Aquella sp.]